MRFCQIVMGPAGSGKSTYCHALNEHCENSKRKVHVANLDPAAEHSDYPIAFDIRDLVPLADVMEEMDLGPNGGLVYCMEYLVENLDWLEEQLDQFAEDDYVVFDCPGQIELYSHLPVMRTLTDTLRRWGFNVVGIYLLDSLFVTDPAKFISGALLSLSAMVALELPHVNVLTKSDLVEQATLDSFLDPESSLLLQQLQAQVQPRYAGLSAAICQLLDDYSMVSFLTMSASDPESVEMVLQQADHAVQYGEDLEPKVPEDMEPNEEQEGMFGGGLTPAAAGGADYGGAGGGGDVYSSTSL